MLEWFEHLPRRYDTAECPYCDRLMALQRYREGARLVCRHCSHSRPDKMAHFIVNEKVKLRLKLIK